MKRNKYIQIKALFLLIVFSLNTITGFACAVGLDMVFNSHHHKESTVPIAEHHDHNKSHPHVESHQHDEAEVHHHDKADVNHPSSGNDNDNCCNDEVMKFQKMDKAIASSVTLISPVFFTSFLASFYNIDILSSNNRISEIKYFVRSHHPPIPDIRIAIQSFQI